jgi:membrane fusion protein, copper/silver efflux system
MKMRSMVIILLLIAAASFLAGYGVNHGSRSKSGGERRILYYVDPMNPAYKSDKPGIAPGCGMPLEPVYADQKGFDLGGSVLQKSMPPGTIRISSEKQQLIGVKLATVEKAPWTYTVRVLGRVTPDETLTYRLNGSTNGWIQEVSPVTTGSIVKKNEILATYSFYSSEYRTAILAYINIMKSTAAAKSTNPDKKAEQSASPGMISKEKGQRAREFENIRLTGRGEGISQVDYYKQLLLNYGISEAQLEGFKDTQSLLADIEIRSPIQGFILSRNVSPGYRFDRGTEFFRIADLSKVWILADLFENEASLFKPGLRVRMELPYQKRSLYGRVSAVLPQFDAASRTLKVRLIADNPGYVLRPDMFVNVELPVSSPPAIVVPNDAVLDSGLKKTIFVDRGNGFFEPREVATGRLLGERVEIIRGLTPGERIVISGNFLMDSEARLQLASAGITGKIGSDPVCRMNLDEDQARTAGNYREYHGRTFFFCSPECAAEFDKNPEKYAKLSQEPERKPLSKSQEAMTKGKPPEGMARPSGQAVQTKSVSNKALTRPKLSGSETEQKTMKATEGAHD